MLHIGHTLEAESIMNWEHSELLRVGGIYLFAENDAYKAIPANYAMASVSTGRSRVFHCYKLSVFVGDSAYVGTDSRSLIGAVQACAENLRIAGLRMRIAATADAFSETGLSYNTGWGYVPGRARAIHMMEFYEPPKAS